MKYVVFAGNFNSNGGSTSRSLLDDLRRLCDLSVGVLNGPLVHGTIRGPIDIGLTFPRDRGIESALSQMGRPFPYEAARAGVRKEDVLAQTASVLVSRYGLDFRIYPVGASTEFSSESGALAEQV